MVARYIYFSPSEGIKTQKNGTPTDEIFFYPHMQQLQGHSCEKTYLRGSRTANALTSVRICAV